MILSHSPLWNQAVNTLKLWTFDRDVLDSFFLMAENVPSTSSIDGREIETETEGAQNGYVSTGRMSL